MDAGSWMEAFERASERLVEDWQVKLVNDGSFGGRGFSL